MTDPTRGTLLADVVAEAGSEGERRPLGLVFEALVLSGLSIVIGLRAGGEHGGVFAIFLTSAALAHRVGHVLRRNRDDIWQRRTKPAEANRAAALRLFSLFGGTTLAFTVAASLLDEEARARFAFAMTVAGIADESILDRSFGTFAGLLLHNVAVWATFFLLALVYRSYGALLALAWNGCVWGVVLTELLRRGVVAAEAPGPALVLASMIAILPHLALEALAYVLASLAAIFASRALVRYGPRDARLGQVMLACAGILAASLLALSLAALLESSFAPWVLDFLY